MFEESHQLLLPHVSVALHVFCPEVPSPHSFSVELQSLLSARVHSGALVSALAVVVRGCLTGVRGAGVIDLTVSVFLQVSTV